MRRGVKVAALSIIAVVVLATAIFTTGGALIAEAYVYPDNNQTVVISDTINEENFGNNALYSAMYVTFSSNNAGEYVNILPMTIWWWYDNLNDTGYIINGYVNYDGNSGTIDFNITIYSTDTFPTPLATYDYSCAIGAGQNNWGMFVYASSSAISHFICINGSYYTSDSLTGLTISQSATRGLTVYKSLIFPTEYYNTSFFNGSSYHFSYGLMSYDSAWRFRNLVNRPSYSDGYTAGYTEGADDWDNFVGWDWLREALSLVGTVLSIEIAPNIYLGYFAAIPLIIGVVLFVLQFKR